MMPRLEDGNILIGCHTMTHSNRCLSGCRMKWVTTKKCRVLSHISVTIHNCSCKQEKGDCQWLLLTSPEWTNCLTSAVTFLPSRRCGASSSETHSHMLPFFISNLYYTPWAVQKVMKKSVNFVHPCHSQANFYSLMGLYNIINRR